MSLDAVSAVQKMQDYIESHLFETVTLADLARAAGYSPGHALRVFKACTGKTPFEYLRAYRLTTAARRLRDGKHKVIDVALDFLFDSHEGFTRAFTREFGVSPQRYREHPVPLGYFVPYDVLANYLIKHKGEQKTSMNNESKQTVVFAQVAERPARRAIIKRGKQAEEYFAYCEEVGCDVWGVLESVKEAMFEPAGFWLPDNLKKPGTSKYVQGVEVPADYAGVVPDGFELIDLAPCKMMIFQGEPYDDADFEREIGEVRRAIERFDPTLYGYVWDEAAPRFQLSPQGCRGYIEALPVRESARTAKTEQRV